MVSSENYEFRFRVKAARALLGWSQTRLAEEARIGSATVADYERGARQPTENNLIAMVEALERGGIEFIDENGGGPGVRLRKRRRR